MEIRRKMLLKYFVSLPKHICTPLYSLGRDIRTCVFMGV